MLQIRLSVKANLEVIISDCFNIASLLNSYSFNFISRTCNRVAHCVAKYALSVELPETWQEDFPTWVSRDASLDFSNLQ